VTPEQAMKIIAAGEALDVEFKGEKARALRDDDLVEAVVCLANRADGGTGYLFIGIEDNGTITGARTRHEGGRTDPLRVQALIAGRTRPSLSVRVAVLTLQEKSVLVVEVPPVRIPVGTSDGKYLRRAVGGDGRPCCVPFHFHEMQAAQADRGLLDYTALAMPDVQWDDLDPLEFERFRRTVRENRARGDDSLVTLPDKEMAKALGAVEGNHEIRAVRVLGLLLFGREEAIRSFLPCHEVAFQVLAGTQVQVNEFFRLPLLRVMEDLLTRFRARSHEEEVVEGLIRVGIPDYPERAFREVMANALVHRDYTRLGAVHVQWYADRIEVSNPGGFPEGVRLDNILVTPPRPRNPLLADAFKRAGVVERTARGIDTIFFEQLRNGRPAPSFGRSTEASVILDLPGGPASTAFVRLVIEEDRAGRVLGLDELLLLHGLRQEGSLTTDRAAALIQKPDPEARAALQRLVEGGLVEGRGQRKGRTYHLSAGAYRRLGERAAYVRQRGFEPLQQEQMVLQYARKHGRITRREAAELCQITSAQARDLVRRMAKNGNLAPHGKLKGTYYTPPSKNMDSSKTDLDAPTKSKRASK